MLLRYVVGSLRAGRELQGGTRASPSPVARTQVADVPRQDGIVGTWGGRGAWMPHSGDAYAVVTDADSLERGGRGDGTLVPRADLERAEKP